METNLVMPKVVLIENVGEEVTAFRYFRVNFVVRLEPGDTVTLTAGSSEEAAYYLALADEKVGLAVSVEDAD